MTCSGGNFAIIDRRNPMLKAKSCDMLPLISKLRLDQAFCCFWSQMFESIASAHTGPLNMAATEIMFTWFFVNNSCMIILSHANLHNITTIIKEKSTPQLNFNTWNGTFQYGRQWLHLRTTDARSSLSFEIIALTFSFHTSYFKQKYSKQKY